MRLLQFCAAGIAALLLDGCDGGSSSAVAGPGALAAPNLPQHADFDVTRVVTPAASAGSTLLTLPFPPSTGYAGQAAFLVAAVPPNLRLTVTYTNRQPLGLSVFATQRRPEAVERNALDALSTDVVYACFSANYLVSVTGAPQFTFVLPPGFGTVAVAYNLAIARNGGWTGGYGGPGAISAHAASATVSVAGRFGFDIPANGTVCTALYGRSTAAPTPVPATPAPSSGGALSLSATPVAVSNGALALTIGVPETLSIATADTPATATTTCSTNAIATLGGSPGATFTLTGTAAGTCSVTLSNAAGKTTTIAVVISAAPALSLSAAPIPVVAGAINIGPNLTDTLAVGAGDAPATMTTTCAAPVATVSGSSGASYTVTGISAGTCTVTLSNAAGKRTTLDVVVSGAILPVQ